MKQKKSSFLKEKIDAALIRRRERLMNGVIGKAIKTVMLLFTVI